MELSLMIEGQEGVTWPQWLALAQACERHGVGALMRSDHYLNVDGRPARGSLEAWGTICALAAVTRTLRLGTIVSPVTFRHPAVLSKLVTTADHVSGGRVELGLGAGWHAREHRAYGLPFGSARERADRLAEHLELLTGMWTESGFSARTSSATLEDLDALPRPVQRPHPPIILGGSAGPRGAALAARYAAEYNTDGPALEQVRVRRAAIEAACAAAGRPMIPFSIMTGVIVAADEATLRRRVARAAERIDADPGRLRHDPPAGWILGTLEEAADALRTLAAAGVDRVMCQQPDVDDLDAVALLGEQLAPLVAASG